jgi:carboxyl-terminal processing protease
MAALLVVPTVAAPAGVLVDAASKGAVVLAVAWLLCACWRRASAASRHLAWASAFGGLLLLPVLSAVAPEWSLAMPVLWPEARVSQAVASPPGPPPAALAETMAEVPVKDQFPGPVVPLPIGPPNAAETAGQANAAAGTGADAQVTGKRAPWSLAAWAVVLWGVGAVLAALPVIVGCFSLLRLRRHCEVLTRGPAYQALHEAMDQLGLRSDVVLLQSDRREVPMTWGLWRVYLLLPVGATEWPPERLRAVLLHELAHVLRRDCLTQLLARLACALHWFNPLAWLGLVRLRLEQERACDDRVLAAGIGAADYAEHLLVVTSGAAVRFFVTPVALAMGRLSGALRLERRLKAILDPARNRRPPRRAAVMATAALIAVVLALLAPMSPRFVSAAPGALASDQDRSKEDLPPSTPAEWADAKKLAGVRARLVDNYIRKIDDTQLANAAIVGMVKSLDDPYTTFIDPKELKEWERAVPGQFAGIGAQIVLDDAKQLAVRTPLEDSPAHRAGIRPKDRILAIDGNSTKGLSLEAAIKLLLGPAATKVKLQVLHTEGKEEEITITRAVVRFRSVAGFRRDAEDHWDYLLDPDNAVGYLRLVHLDGGTKAQVAEVVKLFQDKKVKGVVLDLRFCPGGLLSTAFDVTRQFLAKGKIVSIKARDGKEQVFEADGQAPAGDLPLVVLLNEQTASAAEIIAGALKENDRAVLVGTRSYGKGSVQTIVNLGEGQGALKVTTALYYLPNGRCIQKHPTSKDWGVDPADGYYVPLDGKLLESMREKMSARDVVGLTKKDRPKEVKITPQTLAEEFADPQLAGALKTIQARLKGGEFVKVGKPNAALLARLARREVIEKRREALIKNLEEANKELAELEKLGKEDDNK